MPAARSRPPSSAALSYGTVSLSLMLSLTRSTGSYAVAGMVMALFGATSVFLSPYRASLVDRLGPRRALLPMALLYAALLCVLAGPAGCPGTSEAVLAVTAGLAGACTPPLGPTMRAVWAELLPDRRLLQRAYSVDGVAEELLFVSGPLLVGGIVAVASPVVGVVLSAVLVAVGTLAFVTSPATAALRPAEREKSDGPAAGRGGPGQGRALLQPVVVAAAVGVSVSAVDLLVVAFAGSAASGTARSPGCSRRCRWAPRSAVSSTAPSPGVRPPGRGSRSSRPGSASASPPRASRPDSARWSWPSCARACSWPRR